MLPLFDTRCTDPSLYCSKFTKRNSDTSQHFPNLTKIKIDRSPRNSAGTYIYVYAYSSIFIFRYKNVIQQGIFFLGIHRMSESTEYSTSPSLSIILWAQNIETTERKNWWNPDSEHCTVTTYPTVCVPVWFLEMNFTVICACMRAPAREVMCGFNKCVASFRTVLSSIP